MANEEHSRILKRGVHAWNEWRQEQSNVFPDLSEAYLSWTDLSGARLMGTDLRGADLSGADLSGTDLSGADLSGADLSNADLSRADLKRANLGNSDLSGADLSGAKLQGAILDHLTQISTKWRLVWEIVNKGAVRRDLRGADLRGADLSGADLSGADLSEAKLQGAILDDSTRIDTKWRLVWEIVNKRTVRRNLKGADLREADLRGADLKRADLRGADLREADLREADLKRADLSGASLSGASLSNADFSGADLSGVDFSRARLQVAILNDSTRIDTKWRLVWEIVNCKAVRRDLRGADLSGADLSGAKLGGSKLNGTDLSNADLTLADLSWADLSGANLSGANLRESDLRGANLSRANLRETRLAKTNFSNTDLSRADLSGADLSSAELGGADLSGARLQGAILNDSTRIDTKWRLVWEIVSKGAVRRDLRGADLSNADLSGADLSGADLSEANLSGASLVRTALLDTKLSKADLTNCRVYGVSAWGVQLGGAKQANLIITPVGENEITVDNLEVAQFVYLLLNNDKIRDVINTITTKAVLILGRFTPERKVVLDAIRDKLRMSNYLPILFDFEPSTMRDLTETITTLARLSRFIIADLTDPRSLPQELASIVPDLPSVPVAPLLAADATEYGMFEHFKRYPWVLAIHRYRDLDDLLASLNDKVIAPAETKAKELQRNPPVIGMPDNLSN